MTDEELAEWGVYGRLVTLQSTYIGTMPGHDLVKLWNAFGALEAKVRAMSDDDG